MFRLVSGSDRGAQEGKTAINIASDAEKKTRFIGISADDKTDVLQFTDNFKAGWYPDLRNLLNSSNSIDKNSDQKRTPYLLDNKEFNLYPEPESNRQGKTPTGFWDQRVYLFRHPGD